MYKNGKYVKLTKKLALSECARMWSWLSKDEERTKEQWVDENDYSEIENNCFMCEYVTQKYGYLDCHKCPLLKCWTKETLTEASEDAPCEDLGSTYQKWNSFADHHDIKAAKKIAAFARKLLK